MNRIDLLFRQKQENILSVYFTAGYPNLEDTAGIIKALQENGVDMVEIGIPFSDPMADGAILQMSNQQALKNGMTLQLLYNQLTDIRKEIHIPLIMMGYLNPVLRFGVKKFCEKAAATGIDGIILPDLPMDVYKRDFKDMLQKYGIFMIFLITPETSEERIRTIDREGNGFIYMVSASSTTGSKSIIGKDQIEYFKRIRDMDLRLPALVGFGISSHEAFSLACRYSSGAIIGSAFVKALSENGDLENIVKNFISRISGAKE
jgi:tryptophan synthase alpha chain